MRINKKVLQLVLWAYKDEIWFSCLDRALELHVSDNQVLKEIFVSNSSMDAVYCFSIVWNRLYGLLQLRIISEIKNPFRHLV
jgi:hypothetical protein